MYLTTSAASIVYNLVYCLRCRSGGSEQILILMSVKPNTHRRRRRDETVESRRVGVGVGGVYMNSRRLPPDSAMRTHNAAVWVTTADGCVHTDDATKLSPILRIRVHTADATRLGSFVSSASAVCIGL